MNHPEQRLIDFAVQAHAGKRAKVRRHLYRHNIAVDAILDEADNRIKQPVLTYRIDYGLPENFSFPDLSPMAVVYSQRHMEFASFIRALFVLPHLRSLREEAAQRIALVLIAEFSLRYGNVDIGILAALSAAKLNTPRVVTDNIIRDLEGSDRSEASIAICYHGLAHELGHLSIRRDEARMGLLPDALLEELLETFLSRPCFSKEDALRARQLTSDRGACFKDLRIEALADAEGASILGRATFNILSDSRFEMRVERFIAEVNLALDALYFMSKCKLVAVVLARGSFDQDLIDDWIFQPVSLMVRRRFTNEVLAYELACRYSKTDNPADSVRRQAAKLVSKIASLYDSEGEAVARGMNKATDFALHLDSRKVEKKLSRLAGRRSGRGIAALELHSLISLADALEVSSPALEYAKKEVARAD